MNRRRHPGLRATLLGSTPRSARARRGGWRVALAVVGALTLAGLIAAGGWLVHQRLTGSERMAVRHLVFTGLARASQQELVERAGLVAGANLLAVNLEAAGHAMEEAPWVRRARITRRWPDTLVVAVEEYAPVALVSAGGLYAMDALGTPFKRVERGDGLDLPLVTGLTREQLETGADGGALRLALRLMEGWRRLGLEERAPLAELHVDGAGLESIWTLYGGDEPVELHLGSVSLAEAGPDAPSELLGRLVRVWDELERRGVRPSRIDLGNRQRPEWVAARVD